jgi:hypothetical protein
VHAEFHRKIRRKKPLGRLSADGRMILKRFLKKEDRGEGGSEQGPIIGSCEDGNEASSSRKSWVFLE